MLKKLSLAALVAMGSMSVASATDLSSAIKGVDFGGYLRLRVYNESDKTYTQRYRTTALFQFTMPVSDELKFKTNYSYDWNLDNNAGNAGGNAQNNTPSDAHFFLQYSNAKNGVIAKVGKIPVATPVTGKGVGEALGAGGIVLYKANKDLTVAVAGVDALVNTDKVTVNGKNTYAAAVIYKSEKVNVDVWGFKVDDIIDSDIVVSADVKALKESGVTFHVDYAQAELSDKAATTLKANGDTIPAGLNADKTQTYFNVSATFKKDAVCAKLGYAVTGKDGGVVVLDGDAPIASVFATEQITGIADTTDNNAIYAKVGYKATDKLTPYVAYTTTDKSGDESLVGATYAYTNKFNVKVYYSMFSAPTGGTDNNEARAEFKYSF